MDAKRYTEFQQLVRLLNDAQIVPIVSGGFALEIISGYDLGSSLVPLIIDDDDYDDGLLIEAVMRTAGMVRLDVPELVFANEVDDLSVAFMPKRAVEPVLGHALPGPFIFEQTEPHFYVLTTYDLYNLFGQLIGQPDREAVIRNGDAQKLRFIKQLGYIFDRYPMRQMNDQHPLQDVDITFATPHDYEAIDGVIRAAYDDANYSTGEEERLVRRLRHDQPDQFKPIELVAKLAGRVIGYVMISGAHMAENPAQIKLGVVGPVVVDPLYRGRGLGWRLTQDAEIVARYAGIGVLAAIGWPAYWRQFGYLRASEFGVKPAFTIDNEFFLIKELYPAALLRLNGEWHFPAQWGFD